jgi:hypothetical protein
MAVGGIQVVGMRQLPGPAPPILFLDIDGVLAPWDAAELDPACVERVNQLVASTAARVILTSSWRESMSLPAIQRVLDAAGAEFRLSGATPILAAESRGEEISLWLRDHAPHAEFVILDDGADVRPHEHRWVRPDSDVGMSEGDLQDAMRVLRSPAGA